MKTDKSYPQTPLAQLELDKVDTYSIFDRQSLVTVDEVGSRWQKGSTATDFFNSLPDLLAGRDLREVAERIAGARREGKGVLLGMGAHPIKVGLGPLIASAMEDGILTGIATNGAAIVHDFEMALAGHTSEDVGASLGAGRFGMSEETAVWLNSTIAQGAKEGVGIGAAVGRRMEEEGLKYKDGSLFAAAHRFHLPATVHVAIGTDIIHMHPSCDGAATGAASLADFQLFARQVAALDGGVYINLGSAVIMPEVFLKACSLARNLGHNIDGLNTLNMDFIQHYRPRVNVINRPTASSGKGYALTGHHEIMLPVLLAAVREMI
jgi:hypothetical protein